MPFFVTKKEERVFDCYSLIKSCSILGSHGLNRHDSMK